MPLEITVGLPQLVVHNGETVFISEPDGQLDLLGRKGLMFRDTRLLSTWSLYANGEPWDLLNSGAIEHFVARVQMTNRLIPTQDGDIPPRTLLLSLGRWVEGGVHEDIDIANHGPGLVRFNLELTLRSDFSDVFEVKSGRLVRRGRIVTDWDNAAQRLTTRYENADFRRGLVVTTHADGPASYANGRISFDVALAPGASWHACLLYNMEIDDATFSAPTGCAHQAALSDSAGRLAAWRAQTLRVTCANPAWERTVSQAVDDMAALRLPVDGQTIPAAGLPWFLVLFGRDSLIASLQCLPVSPGFATGTLAVLGARQSEVEDPARDAEPGKILHELRRGELAHFRLIPHTPYFGTADATALYLILLHRTWRWTGDRALVTAHFATALRCLDWIDDWGDRDGDGLQEYGARGPRGYENMGWKDAGDAVLHADGRMASNPKALCELQGYTYAAWLGMAEICEAFGEPARAAALRGKAAALFNRFNDAFWMEEEGFYAFALDGQKRQVRSIASNVGHCLWSGIVRPDRAGRVVARLMQEDMFSGWGVRTLSARHPAYNPISYHNGSVWPHDNGLMVEGFARYGLHAEASRLAGALADAADGFAAHQVPELFSGLPRERTGFPVQCPGANVPQAWAAGSSFSVMQALLGFDPDAPAGVLRVDPHLPAWLPSVTLWGLPFGAHRLDLRFTREGGRTVTEVLSGPADVVRPKG